MHLHFRSHSKRCRKSNNAGCPERIEGFLPYHIFRPRMSKFDQPSLRLLESMYLIGATSRMQRKCQIKLHMSLCNFVQHRLNATKRQCQMRLTSKRCSCRSFLQLSNTCRIPIQFECINAYLRLHNMLRHLGKTIECPKSTSKKWCNRIHQCCSNGRHGVRRLAEKTQQRRPDYYRLHWNNRHQPNAGLS